MGPPGVGKGTQAKKLKRYFDISHLSTGKVLRNEINKKTKIGLKSSVFIDMGELVPDDILLEIVEKHISERSPLFLSSVEIFVKLSKSDFMTSDNVMFL